jgi:hypothetical protein
MSNNISTLISPDILKNLNAAQAPKTFGDQLPNIAKVTILQTVEQSTLYRLEKEKISLIEEGILLDLNHQTNLAKLEQQHTPSKKVVNGQIEEIPPQLNDEEYNAAVTIENTNYITARLNLQERKDKNQKEIEDYLKDPFTKQKEAKKQRQEARKKLKARTKTEKRKANIAKRKAIVQNAKKTLVPIITLLLTDEIAKVIAQNDIIGKLVDDTNTIIESANLSNNQVKLDNAKLTRNNAIRVIQSNEDKINKINSQIQRITIYINIFSTIISILSAIPIPTSIPPGVGIPVSLITKILVLLEKANKIVISLSAYLPTILVSLDKAIQILENYKAQLLPINGVIDTTAALTTNTNLGLTFGTSGNNFGSYRGFTFALKEENNPKFNVRGNKRRYAIAINKNNVEIIKSDFSFTQDPNDLVEQLKLIIDQQNLQG